MLGDLLARAAALSAAYWLTMLALVALSISIFLLHVACWGDLEEEEPRDR